MALARERLSENKVSDRQRTYARFVNLYTLETSAKACLVKRQDFEIHGVRMPLRWIINIMLMPFLLIAVVCAALVAVSIASYDELLERARRFRQS